MKTVKKLLLILLVLCTVFSTAACNLVTPTPAQTSEQTTADQEITADKGTVAETDKKPAVTEKTTEKTNDQTTVTEGKPDSDQGTTEERVETAPPTEEVGGEVTKEPDAPKPPVTDIPVITDPPKEEDTTKVPVVTAPSKEEDTTDVTVVPDPPKEEDTTNVPVVTDPPKEDTSEELPVDPPAPGCTHEWKEGYCLACGATCPHEHATDSECLDCGMQFLRPTLFSIVIYKDNEVAHVLGEGLVTDYLTVGYVIETVWGENWNIVTSIYRIFYNGQEASYNDKIYGDYYGNLNAEIYLETIIVEPPVVTTYYVNGVFYPYPEGLEELPEDYDFLSGYKTIENEFHNPIAVWELLQLYALDPELYDCYLNGAPVTDMENTYLTKEQNSVIILCKQANFKPYTVTVMDRTGEKEVVRTYAFELPMFYSQIRDTILQGMPDTALDVRILGYYDSIYSDELGAAFVKDTTVIVYVQATEIHIERVDGKGVVTEQVHLVIGEVPTLAEFAKTYMGIENFADYTFYSVDGGMPTLLTAEDSPMYGMIAIKTSLLKESFTINYQMSLIDINGDGQRMEYTGSFTLTTPTMLADAIMNAELEMYPDFWSQFYQITVNGVEVDVMEKGPWFTLLFMDSDVVIKSAFRINLQIENEQNMYEESILILEDIDMTMGEFAAKIGVELDRYHWGVGGSTWGETWDGAPLRDLLGYGSDFYLTLSRKMLGVYLSYTDPTGAWLELSGLKVEHGTTLQELLETYNIRFEDYVWYISNCMTYEEICPESADFVFECLPGYSDNYGTQELYAIKAIAKSFTVTVEFPMEGRYETLTFEEPVTAKVLVEKLGYQWSQVNLAWFYDFMSQYEYQLMEDSEIIGFGHLRLELI